MAIPYAFSAQNVSIEQRLNQLELRLQQAENRAAIAEQKNVELADSVKTNGRRFAPGAKKGRRP